MLSEILLSSNWEATYYSFQGHDIMLQKLLAVPKNLGEIIKIKHLAYWHIVFTCTKFPLVFPSPGQTLVQSRCSISDGLITDGIHFEFWKQHR